MFGHKDLPKLLDLYETLTTTAKKNTTGFIGNTEILYTMDKADRYAHGACQALRLRAVSGEQNVFSEWLLF